MVNFASIFVTSLALGAVSLGLASPTPVARSAASVESEITTIITPAVNKLRTDAAAISTPTATLVQILTIITDITTLTAGVTPTTADITASGPFSAADGTTILGDVGAFVPNFVTAVNTLRTKETAVANFPLLGSVYTALIKTDLTLLRTATSAFFTALINNLSTTAQKNTATTYQNQVTNALNAAISAY